MHGANHGSIEKTERTVFQALLIAAGVVIVAIATSATDMPDLSRLLPPEIHGWKPREPDGVYNFNTLYGYIDGSAEVYRSFNVRTVVARRYVKDGAPDIIADVFDMGSSKDAFGAYHHDMHEAPEAGIGQNSEYMGGAVAFWKDRYYVSIIAFDETDDTKRAILDLGKVVARAIPDEGPTPDLLKLLPQRGLVKKRVHYFHDRPCLNAYYFIAEKNLLDLDRNTEGVVARYKPAKAGKETTGASPLVLILVRYPSAARARKAHNGFLDGYLPDADADGAARTENGKWVATQLLKNMFIGVFDAPSKAEARRVINEAIALHLRRHGKVKNLEAGKE